MPHRDQPRRKSHRRSLASLLLGRRKKREKRRLAAEHLEDRRMLAWYDGIVGGLCSPVGDNGRAWMVGAAAKLDQRSPNGESLPAIYLDAIKAAAGQEVYDLAASVRVHWDVDMLTKDDWGILDLGAVGGDWIVSPNAQTLGDDIYLRADKPSVEFSESISNLLMHEIYHVSQYRDAGSMSNYGYNYFRAYCEDGFHYAANQMEKDARSFAEEYQDDVYDELWPDVLVDFGGKTFFTVEDDELPTITWEVSGRFDEIGIRLSTQQSDESWSHKTVVSDAARSGSHTLQDSDLPDFYADYRIQAFGDYRLGGDPDDHYPSNLIPIKGTKAPEQYSVLFSFKDGDTDAPWASLTATNTIGNPVSGPLGSRSRVSDADLRELSWEVTDPAGVGNVTINRLVYLPDSTYVGSDVLLSDAPAEGTYDLGNFHPGGYGFELVAEDNDSDPLRGRSTDRTSSATKPAPSLEVSDYLHFIAIEDDDTDEPIVSFYSDDGTPLLGDSPPESHGLFNTITWLATDASGVGTTTANLWRTDPEGSVEHFGPFNVLSGGGISLDQYGLGEFTLEIVAVDADNDGWAPYTDASGKLIKDPSETTATVKLTVKNDPPDVFAGGPYEVTEGELLDLSASGTDPDPGDTESLVYTWDLNDDGEFDDATGASPSISWEDLAEAGVNDDGEYTISVRATDSFGKSDEDSTSVLVRNAPPKIETLHADPVISENSTLTVTGKYVDPSPADTHQVRVYWGDGSNSLATVNTADRTFTASKFIADDNPTATLADELTIRVEVTDDDDAVNPPASRVLTVDTSTAIDEDFDILSGAVRGIELPSFENSLPAGVSGLLTSAQVNVDPFDVVSTEAEGLDFEHYHDVTLEDTTRNFSFVGRASGDGSASADHSHSYSYDLPAVTNSNYPINNKSIFDGVTVQPINAATGSALVSGGAELRDITGQDHTHTFLTDPDEQNSKQTLRYQTTATYTYTYQPSSPTKLVDMPIQNYSATSNPDVGWVVENEEPRKLTYKDYGGKWFSSPGGVGWRYFYGGNQNDSRMSQFISVPGNSNSATKIAIKNGDAKSHLSGYLGGWGSQEDRAYLRLVFWSGTTQPGHWGTNLGSAYLYGPNAAERGYKAKLMYRAGEFSIPTGTNTIEVLIYFDQRSSDADNDSAADHIQLSIYDHGRKTTTITPDPTIGVGGYVLPEFKSSWGTLTKASVTVKPLPGSTNESRAQIFDHVHQFYLSVDDFIFPGVPSDFGDEGDPLGHGHTVDLGEVQKTYDQNSPLLRDYFLQGENVVLAQPASSHVMEEDDLHAHEIAADSVAFKTTTIFTYDVASTIVKVQNAPPEIVTLSLPTSTPENSTVTLSGEFSDIGAADTHTVLIDWDDDSEPEQLTIPLDGRAFTASHHYNDDNPTGTPDDLLDVVVTVIDDDGGQATATLGLLLENRSPVLTLSGTGSFPEGSVFQLPEASFTDIGLLDTHSATVDWGDESALDDAIITQGAGGGVLAGEHIFTDEGDYPVVVTLTDDDNEADTADFTANIFNVAPTVRSLQASPALEGGSMTMSAWVTDPGDDTLHYTWDFGDDPTGESAVEGVGMDTVEHVYATDGTYTATLTVGDGDGGVTSGQLTILVPDIGTAVSVAGPSTVLEGEMYPLTLSTFTAGAADAIDFWTVDWGDGEDPEVFTEGGIVEHIYANGVAEHTIHMEVTNTSGVPSPVGDLPVTVLNAPPEITELTGSNLPPAEGESFTLFGSTVVALHEGNAGYFSGQAFDAGGDQLTYTWNFGDGSPLESNVSLTKVAHSYADDGVYFVTLTVDDGEGGVVSASIPVIVANLAPTIPLSGAPTTSEGAEYTLTLGAVSDPGDDTVGEWIVDWGDGQTSSYAATGDVTHRFADGLDNHTIQVSLVDEDGHHADAGELAVAVLNVKPEVVDFTGDSNGQEGQRLSLSADVFDPAGAADLITYRWDFGDGSDPVEGLNLANVFHTYADDGEFTLSLTVTDDDGGSSTETTAINIANVVPRAAISGPASVNESEAIELNFGPVLDPGDDSVGQWIVNWGDGSQSVLVDPTSASHVYADGPLTTEIALTLVDEDGSHGGVAVLPIVVLNSNPSITNLSGDANGTEGDAFNFSTTADDPAGLADPLTYQWDFGDGSPVVSGLGLADVSHTFADDGVFTVQASVDDGDGGRSSRAMRVIVANFVPTIAVEGAAIAIEGSSYSLTLGAVTDPGEDDVTQWIVEWGDGSSNSYASSGVVEHTYADGPATHDISVLLADEDGTYFGTGGLAVAVQNAMPTIASVGHSEALQEGSSVEFSATASDPAGSSDTLTYTWEFDDGSAAVSGIDLNVVSHTYADDGVYTVRVTVADEDNGVVWQEQAVTVGNVTPSIAISGFSSTVEAGVYQLALGDVTDPGQDTVAEWVVDWDDGQQQTYTAQQLADVQGLLTHVYADGPATPTIGVSLIDEDGVHVGGSLAVAVRNARPAIDNLSRDDVTDEGSTFSFAAAASDPAGVNDTLTYSWNFGDGTAPVSGVELTDVSHVYGDNGDYTVQLTVADEDGGDVNQFFVVTVENVAPTLTLATPASSVNEGSDFTLNLASVDPGDETISQWEVIWGDGNVETISGNPDSVTHVYGDNGAYNVSASATDEDGTYGADNSLGITVNNVAPTANPDAVVTDEDGLGLDVQALTNDTDPAGANDPLLITSATNGSYGVVTVATDKKSLHFLPDPDFQGADTFTYTIDDGDGGTATGTVSVAVLNTVDLVGRVFDDRGNDGYFQQADGDLGLAGQVVELVDESTDNLIASVVSSASGLYEFDFGQLDLGSGSYTVRQQDQPSGYLDGKETTGNATVVLDASSVDNGVVTNSADSNAITGIVIGVAGTQNDVVDYNFGELLPTSIQGLVWEDFDNDASVDFGELAIDDVAITLTGVDDRGSTVSLIQTTSAQGIYEFVLLRPGTYAVHETAPTTLNGVATNFVDGQESLGQVEELPPGTVLGGDGAIGPNNDQFSQVSLVAGALAVNYNFAERIDGGVPESGMTAGIGFWQNKNGQDLIKSLNGSDDSTLLGTYLAATFPNMYGSDESGFSQLDANRDGSVTNREVADTYRTLFKRNAKNSPAGPPKLDAQVMAVALATYSTKQSFVSVDYPTSSIDNTLISNVEFYGFTVTVGGVGSTTINVGNAGAAFGVADNANVRIIDLLLATDAMSIDGLLYDDLDGDGVGDGEIDEDEELLRVLANDVYAAINETE